jgi:hypothetical protein
LDGRMFTVSIIGQRYVVNRPIRVWRTSWSCHVDMWSGEPEGQQTSLAAWSVLRQILHAKKYGSRKRCGGKHQPGSRKEQQKLWKSWGPPHPNRGLEIKQPPSSSAFRAPNRPKQSDEEQRFEEKEDDDEDEDPEEADDPDGHADAEDDIQPLALPVKRPRSPSGFYQCRSRRLINAPPSPTELPPNFLLPEDAAVAWRPQRAPST